MLLIGLLFVGLLVVGEGRDWLWTEAGVIGAQCWDLEEAAHGVGARAEEANPLDQPSSEPAVPNQPAQASAEESKKEKQPSSGQTQSGSDSSGSSASEQEPVRSTKEVEKPKSPATDVSVSAAQIAQWIEQLGHDSYQVREKASAELARAGLAAADALKAALRHPDLEVRRRARWILAQVLETDHRQRVEQFLADPTGSPEHPLPLWKRYRELVGYDEGARKLFATMQRAEPAMLEAVETGGSAAVEGVRIRLQQIIQRMQFPGAIPYQPSLGSSAAFLFVTALPELELPADIAEGHIHNLVHQQGFQQLLHGPDTLEKAAARRLLGLWILRPLGPQAVQTGQLHSRLQLAMQYRVPEGLLLAVEFLRTKEKVQAHGYMYAQAVSALGLLGGKNYAEHLVPLLEERQECLRIGINNKQVSVEVRDVALAWLVHLTDQKHVDYWMPEAAQEFERLRQIQQYFPNFAAFRYSEGANREEAIKKFKTWLAEHPLPKSPELPKRPEVPKPAKEKSVQNERVQLPLAAAGPRQARQPNPLAQHPEILNNKPNFFLPRADRLLVRTLGHAQEAIHQNRFAEAVRILGEILASEEDYTFQPDPGEPLYRTVKAEAARLLSQLPPEGLQLYQGLYEPRARKTLQEAVGEGHLQKLQTVVDRFFFTRSGAEALYLMGRAFLDRGQPSQAALAAKRLRRHPLAEDFEPMLSLLEAIGWYRAGELSAAETALGLIPLQMCGKTVIWAGQQDKLFLQPSERIDWLRTRLIQAQSRGNDERWSLAHINSASHPSTQLGMPYLKPVAHWPVCPEPILADLVKQIRRELQEEFRPALVQLRPLMAEGKVVFYTSTQLQAVDLVTGQLAWVAPLEDPLRLFLQPYEKLLHSTPPPSSSPTDQPQGDSRPTKLGRILAGLFTRQLRSARASILQQSEWDESNLSVERLREILIEGLHERFWGETGFGLLSSDGRRVYGLEDIPFRFPVQFQRVVVTADGRRRPEPYVQKNYNLLVAYDLQTGKALWELGGPPDVEGMKLAGAYFLGPPFPLGGRLYVVALIDEETQLLELAAETGLVLSRLRLSAKQSDSQPQQALLMAMGIPLDRVRGGELPHSMPAYADGILVCRTADNHYVAVDLMTRSIRWIYEAAQEEEELSGPAGIFGLVPAAIRRAYAAWKQQDDRWLDTGILIGEGYVVLTPPSADKLICLRLVDGHRQWSVSRRDGLFVAAVADGKVVVVGREGLWAVRLEDGQPAWATGSIAWPAGSLPAGRGYRKDRYYYLPLTTAEVAAFDLEGGRLVARSRSPQQIIPGNLVAGNAVILSQDVDGLYRWEILDHRAKQTQTCLTQSPHDPQALLDHAEVLLAQGQWQNCLDLLQQAKPALGPSAQTQAKFQKLVADAAQDGLLLDPPGLLARLEQIEQLRTEGDLQTYLTQLLAQAYRQQGQIETAFDRYLSLLRQTDKLSERHQRLSTGHTVRQDRLLAAQLAELYRQAPPELRTKLETKIHFWKQPDRLEDFLRYFAFHPETQHVRLELAHRYVEAGRFLEAEWLLQSVFEQAEPAKQRLAAVRLAELYRKTGRHEAAAAVYRLLAGPWANLVCADGKTGRQLLEALPTEDPVQTLLAAKDPWPLQPIKVESISKPFAHRYGFSLNMMKRTSFAPALTFRFDPNQHHLEIGHPSGKKTEPISISRPPIQLGINHNLYSYSQGVLRGHTLIAWLGNLVAGVDLLSEPRRNLWIQPIQSAQSPHPLFGMVVLGGQRPLRQSSPFLANEPLPLVVTSHTVCFQQDRKLVAVDPLKASEHQPLWSRTDLPEQADLFGDEEVLLVTGPGQQEATVLSTLDGSRLGTRRVPPMKNRLLVWGRRVLCWKSEQQACQALLEDPWKQQILWKRDFPAKSQPWPLVDEGRLAVLAPSGVLVLLDLETGQDVFQTSVDPEPNLDNIVVLTASNRYFVLANRPFQPTGPIFVSRQLPDAIPVHGRLTALDRQTAQPLWSTEVLEQTLRLDQPGDLPILVFYNISYRQGTNPRGDIVTQPWENLLCLDVRTGAVVHQSSKMGVGGFGYEITAQPQDRTISISTLRETVRLRFGSP
ncbi:MAG: PQQ-binding-like beta-propeller repeat protein [Thermoguttaceae bacterium]|nr:PQQ-binding-like beta-propeller repeat protein [Thermoguttaceae bacterium]MDW8039385.1 PQQ-binding-like beta-propeller repeat protein [Thermoguttaceae bacterium]